MKLIKHYSITPLLTKLNLIFTILLFFGFTDYLSAQELKTPDDFKLLVYKSTLNYNFEEIIYEESNNDYEILPDNLFLLEFLGEKAHVKNYEEEASPKATKIIKQGEILMMKGNYEKARKCFKKVLKIHPRQAQIKTKIGETYYQENEISQAREWASDALKDNFIHYPAHILMSKIYLRANRLEESLEAITLAHLFNRNDPKVRTLLKQVYDKNGKVFDDSWGFDPKFDIQKTDRNVNVQYYTEAWEAYARCQAVWEHEPHYDKKMALVDSDLALLQEKECMLNYLITYEKMEESLVKEKIKLAPYLKKSIDKNVIDEFIWYEVMLVKNPYMALHLTQSQINDIAKYLFEIRSYTKRNAPINEN